MYVTILTELDRSSSTVVMLIAQYIVKTWQVWVDVVIVSWQCYLR